jgi:hypothetical protein
MSHNPQILDNKSDILMFGETFYEEINNVNKQQKSK